MRTSGVFEVLEEIPEIGARPGDMIVVDPRDPWMQQSLVRPLGRAHARWVASDRCRPVTLHSHSSRPSPATPSRGRSRHLRLL